MLSSHLRPKVIALLSTLALASCGGGEQAVSTTPEYPVLFKDVGEVQSLSGTNVLLGEWDPIRSLSGHTSSDGTEIGELDFREAYYLGTQELPDGTKMDKYRIYLSFSGLNQYSQTVVEISDIEIWIAAPNTENEALSLEFSEIHKFENRYRFYIDASVCYGGIGISTCPNVSETYRGFGVSGIETEILPEGTPEYRGIWVGRMTSPANFTDYAGETFISVDFTDGTVFGRLFNPQPLSTAPTPSWAPETTLGEITLDGQVDQGKILGDANLDVRIDGEEVLFNGDVHGHLFGPAAEEIGGVVDLDGYSGTYGSIGFSGAFIGEQ